MLARWSSSDSKSISRPGDHVSRTAHQASIRRWRTYSTSGSGARVRAAGRTSLDAWIARTSTPGAAARARSWGSRTREQLADKQRHAEDLLAPLDVPRVAAAGRAAASRATATRRRWSSAARSSPDARHPRRRRARRRPAALRHLLARASRPRSRCSPRSSPARSSRPTTCRAARGELKHLSSRSRPTASSWCASCCARHEPVARIRKHLPCAARRAAAVRVVTVNVLPEHKAVLEGEHEIVLTDAETLPMRVNDVTLHLRPQSFFQTNTEIAAALYRRGARLGRRRSHPTSVWDLYCGRRRLRAARRRRPARDVIGIETSVEAVASAELSRSDAALCRACAFAAGDATAFALGRRRRPRPRDREPAAARHRRRAQRLARGIGRVARALLQLQRRVARPRSRGDAVAAAGAGRGCSTCSRRPRTSR